MSELSEILQSRQSISAITMASNVPGGLGTVWIAGRAHECKRNSTSLRRFLLRDETGSILVELVDPEEPLPVHSGDILAVKGVPVAAGDSWRLMAQKVELLRRPRRSVCGLSPYQDDLLPELRFLRNPEQAVFMRKRAEVLRSVRRFLDERGFIETETPIITLFNDIAPLSQFDVSGTNASLSLATRKREARAIEAYETVVDSLHLRTCAEYHLKRLLVAGFERIYEIGRSFRDDLGDVDHGPEFTMLEFFQAYSDHKQIQPLTRDLLLNVVHTVGGNSHIRFRGHNINFENEWQSLSVRDALALWCPGALDIEGYPTAEELREAIITCAPQVPVAAQDTRRMLIEHLLHTFVEPRLIQPTFLCNHPAETICVAEHHDRDPRYVKRWELYIGGVELANGLADVTDPIEQRERMLEVLREEKGNAHPLDEDYLRSLEYGLPPTAGVGIGIDRLTMLMTGAESIDEVIAFPWWKATP